MMWKKYKTGVALFCIFVVFMISKSKEALDPDILIAYIIDYKTGFGARKLVASVLSALVGVPTMGEIRLFAYALTTLVCAIFAWSANKFVQKMQHLDETSYMSALYMLVLYLICPASLMFLLKYPNVGRLDIFLYASCLLLCYLFYHRNDNRLLYYAGITLLLVLAILTHHIFVATYMAFFVALFVYDIWEFGFNRQRFLSYVVVGVIACCALASVLMLSSMSMSLDEAIHYNPHMELSRKFVCFGYYAHLSDHLEQYVLAKWPRLVAGFSLTVLFLAPLFVAFWKVWRDLYRSFMQEQDKRLMIGMQCAFLLFIPAFCITVDYLRWFGAFIFLQFLLIAYFSYDRSTRFCNIIAIVNANLRKYVFFAAMLLVYCAILGYFTSDTYFDIVELIMEKLHIHRVTTLLPLEYRI